MHLFNFYQELRLFKNFITIFAANFEIGMYLNRFKSLLVVSLSLMAIIFSTAVMANENHATADTNHAVSTAAATAPHEAKEEGDFNVTETILEHIKDDHSWHLWGHTSIHLPVIVKTNKGFEFFSSGKLVNEDHKPIVYKGNFDYKLVEGKLKIVDANGNIDKAANKQFFDLSITKNVASLFVSVLILLIVALLAGLPMI